MRKYRQALLIVVTVATIISFVWFYNGTRETRGDDGKVGMIYDRPVRLTDYQRGLRRMQMCQELGMFELVGGLAGDARTMEQAQPNFIFGTYVLQHEAAALGIEPTEDEVVEGIKALQAFQNNGAFDKTRYELYTQRLASFGFTHDQIEEAVRDSLRLEKLKALVGTTLSASPSELREAFADLNQKVEIALVRLKEADFAKEIQISDEDLKKAYDERKANFQTEQLRKVKVATFVLTEEESKLQGSQRGALLQKLMEKSNEFAVAMAEKGAKLDGIAAKTAVKIVETPEFSRGAPPKELGESSTATAAAFDRLTIEQPNSDPVISEKNDGYYVMHLTAVTPARQQTLDEVKPMLTEVLKRERTSEKITAKATEARAKIDADLKAGKTFEDAAKVAGLVAEKLPAFSMAEPPKEEKPGIREIQRAQAELAEGTLSEVLTARGGERIIFRVEKRLPIDEAAFQKEKVNLAGRFNGYQTENAFRMWFAERRKASGLDSLLFKTGA
ncbi:MAG: SurA N-terminal domain-containing protein [Chthoniobacteraceae bacterium]